MEITAKEAYRFLVLLALCWLAVPLMDGIGQLFCSREFFAFRAWEIARTGRSGGGFAPGLRLDMESYGDLANMIKVRRFRHYRRQQFTTDSYGFRNPEPAPDAYYPVVVTGDSDMAGSALSDNETFSAGLTAVLNMPVYNHAPGSPVTFFADPRFQKRPPKILIWEAVGRTISGSAYGMYKNLPVAGRYAIKRREAPKTPVKLPRISSHFARNIFHEARWYVSGLHSPQIGAMAEAGGMLFYAPALESLHYTAAARGVAEVALGVARVAQICAARGITLIYVPLPDKEDVYRRDLPAAVRRRLVEPSFLSGLYAALDEQKVVYINLYDRFRKYAAAGGTPLYFVDDTHWSPKGVALAVELTAREIRRRQLLAETPAATVAPLR